MTDTKQRPQFTARKLGSEDDWDKLMKVELFLPKRVLRNLVGAAHKGNAMGLILEILTDVSKQIEDDNK